MTIFKVSPEEMLAEVEMFIRLLELEEFNVGLEGDWNPDMDDQLEFVRFRLDCARREREAILEVINKSRT